MRFGIPSRSVTTLSQPQRVGAGKSSRRRPSPSVYPVARTSLAGLRTRTCAVAVAPPRRSSRCTSRRISRLVWKSKSSGTLRSAIELCPAHLRHQPAEGAGQESRAAGRARLSGSAHGSHLPGSRRLKRWDGKHSRNWHTGSIGQHGSLPRASASVVVPARLRLQGLEPDDCTRLAGQRSAHAARGRSRRSPLAWRTVQSCVRADPC